MRLPAQAAGSRSPHMEIPNGNTAPTDAMSGAGSKAVMKVRKEQFQAERLYLMSRSVAKSMLKKGILSEEEYAEIDTALLKKYRPVLGTLLSGKPLL